jgi:hypothetical protein
MSKLQENRRFWEVMVGLLLIVLGLGALGSAWLPGLLIGIGGLMVLAHHYNHSTNFAARNEVSALDEAEINQPTRSQTGAEQVYPHAIRAAERVGHRAGDMQVLPVDIGLLAFRAGEDPVVYRLQPVSADVDYVQPFVQIRLPKRATGRVRFELADSDGRVLFIHEDMHQLQRGRNLVTPAARLPIHDALAMHDLWELRVSADGVPLATHRFEWTESKTQTVRRHLREDGEISSELRAAIVDNAPADLSLDELLAFQDEAESQQRNL